MPKKLTNKQEQFCQEYLIDLNATQAAIRAGYSKRSARITAHENLTKPNIEKRIAELKLERSKETKIDQIYVLKKLKTWLEADVRQFMGLSMDQINELPLEIGRLITGFKETRTILDQQGEDKLVKQVVELKFPSKEKAMEMINRHIGFYEVDNNQKGQINYIYPPKIARNEQVNNDDIV